MGSKAHGVLLVHAVLSLTALVTNRAYQALISTEEFNSKPKHIAS